VVGTGITTGELVSIVLVGLQELVSSWERRIIKLWRKIMLVVVVGGCCCGGGGGGSGGVLVMGYCYSVIVIKII